MSLYLILLICSIAVPLVLSFDSKLQFYRQWRYLMPAIITVAIFYIAFDIYFTHRGVWGFNPQYHSSLVLYQLPLEEWLFFIIIPYASIFLHDSIVLYFKRFSLPQGPSRALTVSLIIFALLLVAFNLERAYTTYIFSLLTIALILSLFDKSGTINSYYLTFLVILIPFVAVNAILTGTLIDSPVVWYNNDENLGIRFLTIPIEDFGYAFSLILFNLLLRNRLQRGKSA